MQIDAVGGGGIEEHSGLGLSARTVIGRVVIAGIDGVERQFLAKAVVDGFDAIMGLDAAGDVGLIGDDEQEEAGIAKAGEGFGHAGFDTHRLGIGRWMRFSGEDEGFDQDAVAVEEDCGTILSRG
jgi:hypothetical protein